MTSPGPQGNVNQEDVVNSGERGKAAGSLQNQGAWSSLLL